jgi:hypothetical protein
VRQALATINALLRGFSSKETGQSLSPEAGLIYVWRSSEDHPPSCKSTTPAAADEYLQAPEPGFFFLKKSATPHVSAF